MPFRSDRDADRARIEALEHDLAASRRRIDESMPASFPCTSGGRSSEPGELVFENARCAAWHSRPCSIELIVHDGRSTLTCTEHQDALSAPLWFAIASVSLIRGFTCLGWTGFTRWPSSPPPSAAPNSR